MSIETWKKEFYPIKSEQCPVEEALANSLLKWKGFLPNNLKKHNIKLTDDVSCGPDLIDDCGDTYFLYGTCALCRHHWCETKTILEMHKSKCPLSSCRTAWKIWIGRHDPRPMITKIKAAIKARRQKEARKCKKPTK